MKYSSCHFEIFYTFWARFAEFSSVAASDFSSSDNTGRLGSMIILESKEVMIKFLKQILLKFHRSQLKMLICCIATGGETSSYSYYTYKEFGSGNCWRKGRIKEQISVGFLFWWGIGEWKNSWNENWELNSL